jgi:hypothetical protein
MLPFRWVPWFINFKSDLSLYGWIVLGNYSIAFNVDPEENEVLIARFKHFTFCRFETEEEKEERLLESEILDDSFDWYY